MTQSGPGETERTPEQHDAVRRRGRPVSLCAALCGIASLALLLMRTVGFQMPPSIFAVNLSFCAILMGVVLLFYVRKTPRMSMAIAACLVAIATGLAGTMVYAWQTTQWRAAIEERELGNVQAIAAASRAYALENGGLYPPDLVILLQQGKLKIDQLHSPYGSAASTDKRKEFAGKNAEFDKWYATHSDYLYFGADLRVPGITTQPSMAPSASTQTSPAGTLPDAIIVACGTDPILRQKITIGYANGKADFLDFNEAKAALEKSNEARRQLGLPDIQSPEAIRKAEELERRQ